MRTEERLQIKELYSFNYTWGTLCVHFKSIKAKFRFKLFEKPKEKKSRDEEGVIV